MRTMAQWLKHPSMQNFIRNKQKLARLNQCFEHILESRFHGLCEVIGQDEHTLWCQASDAAMATQLRFQAPMLLPLLRKRLNLPQLSHMVVRVKTRHAPPPAPTRLANRPNADAAHCLQDLASHTQHPALKASLLRLAKQQR